MGLWIGDGGDGGAGGENGCGRVDGGEQYFFNFNLFEIILDN